MVEKEAVAHLEEDVRSILRIVVMSVVDEDTMPMIVLNTEAVADETGPADLHAIPGMLG